MSETSTGLHRKAKEAFYGLERMDPNLRSEVLADEEHEVHHTPCSAGMTAVIFRRLGVDVDEFDIYWEKLYRRPISRVFNLYTAAKDVEPEQLNHLFTVFAKRVQPLEEAS